MMKKGGIVFCMIMFSSEFIAQNPNIFDYKGRMINYTINDKTLKLISGDNKHYKSFEEIWYFNREGNKWLLNEIDQKVTIYSLLENSPEEDPLG